MRLLEKIGMAQPAFRAGDGLGIPFTLFLTPKRFRRSSSKPKH